jgi:hypothetical protein
MQDARRIKLLHKLTAVAVTCEISEGKGTREQFSTLEVKLRKLVWCAHLTLEELHLFAVAVLFHGRHLSGDCGR